MHGLLAWPGVYALKTRLASMGRRPVQRRIEALREACRPARVLDLACGPGRHAPLFARTLYLGADLDCAYLRHARRGHPEAAFAAMDAMRLALPDAAFDLVFAAGLFHHLGDAAAAAAALEMRRVTRPGGCAVVIDQVMPGPANPLGRLLARADRGDHVRNPAALEALLAPAGFRLVCAALPGSWPWQRAVLELRSAPCTPRPC